MISGKNILKILFQRRLAARFGTTPTAVYQAIVHLRKNGYVYTRGGSGVYLTDPATEPVPPPQTTESPTTDVQPDGFVGEGTGMGAVPHASRHREEAMIIGQR